MLEELIQRLEKEQKECEYKIAFYKKHKFRLVKLEETQKFYIAVAVMQHCKELLKFLKGE